MENCALHKGSSVLKQAEWTPVLTVLHDEPPALVARRKALVTLAEYRSMCMLGTSFEARTAVSKSPSDDDDDDVCPLRAGAWAYRPLLP